MTYIYMSLFPPLKMSIDTKISHYSAKHQENENMVRYIKGLYTTIISIARFVLTLSPYTYNHGPILDQTGVNTLLSDNKANNKSNKRLIAHYCPYLILHALYIAYMNLAIFVYISYHSGTNLLHSPEINKFVLHPEITLIGRTSAN